MRSGPALLRRQNVCLLCASRLLRGNERLFLKYRPVRQTRCYQPSRKVAAPAGAAVAQKEDGEDQYTGLSSAPSFEPSSGRTLRTEPLKPLTTAPNHAVLPDWKCRCGHVTVSTQSQCSKCAKPRGRDSQLVYHPSKPAPRSPFRLIPLQERPANPQSQHVRSTAGADDRSNVFRGDQEVLTSHMSSPPIRRKFGAFLHDMTEKVQTTQGRTDTGQPPISHQSRWQMSNMRSTRSDAGDAHKGFNHSPAGIEPQPQGHRSTNTGSTEDISVKAQPLTQFLPFVRKVKPSEGLESSRRWNTISNANTPPRTTTRSALPTVEPRTIADILPPAADSFNSHEDEPRRKRNDRSNQRSQRYQIDDIDAVESQNSNVRDKASGFRRGAKQDIDEEALLLEDEFIERRKKKSRKQKGPVVQSKPMLQLPDFISVEQLSRVLKVRLDGFLHRLEEEGFEGARYDHILDAESSAMIADTYGFEASFGESQALDDLTPLPVSKDRSSLPPRPPVVTIMGHVDHGKTTILDWLRRSSVVASEHGGITQHIGAFSVKMPGSQREITFLDTPGHAAFLEMRKRGAVVTDIVVLVVAADDSVKPQTIEAIKHALEAKVHIIVAINKVDKEDANVTRVKQDLAAQNIVVEEYGGDYQAIELSGKTGKGMEELEEAILTLADVSDFRAETDGQAEGWILESKVTAAGRVATILVRRGTLRISDCIVAGTTWARVKTLRNDAGALVDEALPGTPVQVDGWRGEDPSAGLEVLQADSEEHAKDVVDIRLERLESQRIAENLATMNSTRTEAAEARAKVLSWEAEQSWAKKKRKPADNEGWVEGNISKGAKLVHFVIKADVAGSVEALVAAVSAVGNNEIRANIVHSATGVLSESDIRHLTATGETAYAISFNQPVDGTISQLAHAADLQILDHNIIYKVTDDVKEKLAAELPPLITQRVLGEAEIGKVFEITTKQGKVKVAGCRIHNGSISRSHKVRVLRNGETVYTGKLDSLRNVKKDVGEMRKGTECGIGFSDWEDFREGDQVQTYEEERTPRKLY